MASIGDRLYTKDTSLSQSALLVSGIELTELKGKQAHGKQMKRENGHVFSHKPKFSFFLLMYLKIIQTHGSMKT